MTGNSSGSVANGGKASLVGGQTGAVAGSQSSGHQPVEFNHAINYVNKIKVYIFLV